ncbi:MAG: xanthine dehydrogenase family protein subunit M [Candidatus Promineifilaceae bacterium]
MKPAPFLYEAPTSLVEALSLLAQHGFDAKPLAGGQSLVPAMNFRLAMPGVLVDLNGLPELRGMRRENGRFRIGAMVRQRVLEKDVELAAAVPLLAQALPHIAHPQIRNRGTIGGSLAHADPAAELPVVCVALDARFRLQSTESDRWVTAVDFFTGLFMTARADEELLTEIELPVTPPGTGTAFVELARRHGDYALAGVAAVVKLRADGHIAHARLVYLNAGEKPVVAWEAGQMLAGERPSAELFTAAAQKAAVHEINPVDDVHASATYKRHLTQVLTKRALQQAVQNADGNSQ